MTKVEQARDIFTSNNAKNRGQIIALIMSATDSGEAYSSTLYNKARKLSLGTVVTKSKSGNKEAFVALGKKIDEKKVTFLKNCYKVQGLKAGHYRNVFEYAHKNVEVVGVNKTGDLMIVKAGTNVRVNIDTTDAMKVLRKMKFLGKK